jgi:hypothetical protein
MTMAQRAPKRWVDRKGVVLFVALGVFALAFLVESLLPSTPPSRRRGVIVLAALFAFFAIIIVHARRHQLRR